MGFMWSVTGSGWVGLGWVDWLVRVRKVRKGGKGGRRKEGRRKGGGLKWTNVGGSSMACLPLG